jgi:general secretion pathway protein K
MNARAVPRLRQRGAALLMAMLTVSLVATFAAAALWQQWRSIEVEGAERARIQSEWILTGALDWARLLLREDGKAGGPDHLGEPWAVPLQEARLSSFLAAENSTSTDNGPDALAAFLSGQVTDLQSLLNVSNLLDTGGKLSEPDLLSFVRLFEVLGLPSGQLEQMAENLRLATAPGGGERPLVPQDVEQLVWLGLSPQTVAALRPYITILPARTPVNLNTASAQVIYAAEPGLSMAQAQQLVSARERSPFRTHADAANVVGGPTAMAEGQANVAFNTRFFEVRARLRLDQLIVEERSIVQRDNADTKVLLRERGPAAPTPQAQTAANR